MKNNKLALSTLSSLLLALALSACTHGAGGPADPKQAPATKSALTVAVVKPRLMDLDKRLSASGGLFAWQEASVGAEVGGLRIVDLRANVGDVVKKGQLLAQLSKDSVRTDLAQQEAAVAEAQAALAQAQANAARSKTLEGARAISAQDLLAAQTTEASAAAKLKAARASLDAQKLRLSQTSVVAPDSGTISARTATVGQVASAGAELFKLVRQNRLEWRAELSASDILKVKVGQAVKVTLPDGETLAGLVRQVAPTLDAASRSGLVYVDLPADSKAKAGMFVSGEILLGKAPAQVVPGESVVVRDGTSYLMSVDSSNKVHALKVTTGQRDAEQVEVLGLPAGDVRVVGQGAGFLKDGDTVKVVTEKGVTR